MPLNPNDEFSVSLARGKAGELLFKTQFEKEYGLTLEHISSQPGCERESDFLITKLGSKLEVKTEYLRSPNVYVEYLSDVATGALGGLRRALRDNVAYYAFFHPNDPAQQIYIYPTVQLALHLFLVKDSLRAHFKASTRNGVTWRNQGYTLPKSDLRHIEILAFEGT